MTSWYINCKGSFRADKLLLLLMSNIFEMFFTDMRVNYTKIIHKVLLTDENSKYKSLNHSLNHSDPF